VSDAHCLALLGLVSLELAGCAAGAGTEAAESNAAVAAIADLAADALFHRDPRWRGADCAYSIDLGGARTLWLFGDSFVARPGAVGRRGCAMPRNTIALMVGDDPRTATMEFAWRGTEVEPGSWFPEDGELWHWPLHGLRAGDAVIVFCSKLKRDGDGIFGFRQVGCTAFRITGVDLPLAQWTVAEVPVPRPPFDAAIGTAVVADGAHVYAYALREPGDHALWALRWQAADFARGVLCEPEWFDAGTWRAHTLLREAPAPILAEAAPEFTVHGEPAGDGSAEGFVMVQVLGFPAGELALRTAPRPEGPWSDARVVYTPPENTREHVLLYSGKAHPQLAGPGLLATYSSNHADFATLVDDLSLYWPRFVRVGRP
jgi:hypothetical protein